MGGKVLVMPLAYIGFAVALLGRRYPERMRGRRGASARQVFPESSLHKGRKGRGYFLPAGVRLERLFQVAANRDGRPSHTLMTSPIGEIGEIGELTPLVRRILEQRLDLLPQVLFLIFGEEFVFARILRPDDPVAVDKHKLRHE